MSPSVMPFQLSAADPTPRPFVLRALGQPDLTLDGPMLTFGTHADAEVITFHPAGRLLAIWGRTPTGLVPPPGGRPEAMDSALSTLSG